MKLMFFLLNLRFNGLILHFNQLDIFKSEDKVCEGISGCAIIQAESGKFGETWDALCIPAFTDEFEELSGNDTTEFSKFRGKDDLKIHHNPSEVEHIQGITISSMATLLNPPDIFAQSDGSVNTMNLEESRAIFEILAIPRFFAYLPLSFWKQIVINTNMYAALNEKASNEKSVELDERLVEMLLLTKRASFIDLNMRDALLYTIQRSPRGNITSD